MYSTEEGDKIDEIEALELELGDDGREGVIWSRDVVIGPAQARTQRVPSTERNRPIWPTSLKF